MIYILIKYAGLYEEMVGTYYTREDAEKMMNKLMKQDRKQMKKDPYYSGYEYAINAVEIF